MIEHPNSLLVHHCLQAASDGDRNTLRALWAPDIVWHVKGRSPWRGDIKGPEQILDYLAEVGRIGPKGLHAEIEDVMVSAERVTMLFRARAEIKGGVLDADYLILARIMRGRIQEITSIPVDEEHAAKFWSAQDISVAAAPANSSLPDAPVVSPTPGPQSA